VCVNAKQPLEDVLDDLAKVFRKWYIWQHRETCQPCARARRYALRSPTRDGNTLSLSSISCTHTIRRSTYSGADTLMGFLILVPSAHRYSYLSERSCVRSVGGEHNVTLVLHSCIHTFSECKIR
jgi:hypothetical protein